MIQRLFTLFLGIASMAVQPETALAQDAPVQIARVDPQAGFETQLGDLYGPLGAQDTKVYRDIFAAQDKGDWRQADQLIARLQNSVLIGHVLAQRYLHPTAYRSKFQELHAWLDDYADLPQSGVIYELARKRKSAGDPALAKPVAGYLGGSGQELVEENSVDFVSRTDRAVAVSRDVTQWLDTISSLIARDRPTQATGLLKSRAAKAADAVEFDIARWLIGKSYFANQIDDKALSYAAAAADRSGKIVPQMHWTAGLAAWRLGKLETAVKHFTALAQSDASGDHVAAGAFWAARAFQALRQYDRHQSFLKRAAAASDGFYGQLAQEITGISSDFEWHEDALRGQLRSLVLKFPAAQRAIALVQTGQTALAAKEIRKLAARARPQLTQALAALAESLALPAAQMRVAQRLRLLDGRRHDGALYPVPSWQPTNGYAVDRALIFALARAESGFDPEARSHADARGLMQILPSTARQVASAHGIPFEGAETLNDPTVNLDIGQAFVAQLLDNRLVDGSLIHLVVGYNAGLKRLENWVDRLGPITAEDPLLFLESIPVPETRQYAKKVIGNLWAYRARLEQQRASLTQLAQSDWPVYQRVERGPSYAWAD